MLEQPHMIVATYNVNGVNGRLGRALRARMWPAYAAAIRSVVETRLSASEADALAKLMNKLRSGVGAQG